MLLPKMLEIRLLPGDGMMDLTENVKTLDD